MDATTDLHPPAYGHRSLADLVPSLLNGLGLADFPNPLDVPALRGVCLLLIDGLGWALLQRYQREAPFLARTATREPLTATFPSTTPVSLTSLGTGRPPGEHGIVGLALPVPDGAQLLHTIRWQRYGPGPVEDLRARVVPEHFQPQPTAFELAAAAGIAVTLVGPGAFAGSGLTRAGLRGGQYRAVVSFGDLVSEAIAALAARQPAFVYAYHADLDRIGHERGTASEAWRLQLAHIDQLAAQLAERLPAGCALVVTADHGMLDLAAEQRLDVAELPELMTGVRLLGGEPRVRYVYTEAGAAPDVRATWQAVLGERMWVLSREEAIARGWYGPRVTPAAAARLGDVIAVAQQPIGIVQRAVDPHLAGFTGQHGGLTADEQLVPFCCYTNSS